MENGQLPVNLFYWALAAAPIVVLLILLVGLRWSATEAAPVGMFVAAGVALLALEAPWEALAVAGGKGIWDAIFVLYVVWPALLLYRAGAFTALRQGIERFSRNGLRVVETARSYGKWIIWVYWYDRPDRRNLGAPTLHSFKHAPGQRGIGEELEHGPVLRAGSWGAETVDELKPYEQEDDVRVEKVRMSGFYGTHLHQVLRTQGINTLFFTGVNTDQCVTATMEDAYFHDYNTVLLSDATSTPSPDYCKDAVVFDAKNCWGFVTDTERFANARPFGG